MRPRQIILLGLLLLVPVLAFLFLYGFGNNHYALPTYLPMRVDSVQIAGGGWQRDTVYKQVRFPSLVDAACRAVTGLPQSEGPYVVQVLTAPTGNKDDEVATRSLARLQETFRPRPQVRLVTLVPLPSGESSTQSAVQLQRAEPH